MSGKALSLETTKVLAGASEGVGWITLNNPGRRNAVSLDMWKVLGDESTRRNVWGS
jgi:enoyl-CoA hydratase/carnithine racemase